VWKNPQVTVEATRWLHARGSRMHGVEGPSTDRPTENTFAQHRLCRDLGMTHWEWLVNLEELIGKGEFQFFGVPLKLKGGSGSPVRAFAIVEEGKGRFAPADPRSPLQGGSVAC
jgi:kynurenine formamidase